jgi:hypothetical protein
MAAILASKNFTSSDEMIEAKRGWANTISTKQDYREISQTRDKHETKMNRLTGGCPVSRFILLQLQSGR